MEEAAESFARLDEAVAGSAPGLGSVLMLRSAQTIVATRVGPLGAPVAHAPVAHEVAREVAREVTFAGLLGWWYAAESREFVNDDRTVRRCALALDATAEKLRGGRTLTLALLREGVDVADDEGASGSDASGSDDSGSDVIEATLRQAMSESWPSLLLAAELLSGGCAPVPGMSAAIARAAAPLIGGLSSDVFVVAPAADDAAAALHGLAVEARNVRRLVDRYRAQCADAAERALGFGRGAHSALALLQLLAGTPAITVVGAALALGVTVPTLAAAVDRLVAAGLLREITGRGRDRVFVYTPAIALAG